MEGLQGSFMPRQIFPTLVAPGHLGIEAPRRVFGDT
jgi:hypothetical protein